MKDKTLIGIFAAWTAAWIVALYSGRWELLVIAGFAFPQNVAFTFVSRGRNSGSIAYHLIASIFSNGIWLVNQIFSVAVIASEFSRGADWQILTMYGVVYTLSTMPGSIFAHWLAKRWERGKARNVQEDRIQQIEEKLDEVIRLRGWRLQELRQMGIDVDPEGKLVERRGFA